MATTASKLASFSVDDTTGIVSQAVFEPLPSKDCSVSHLAFRQYTSDKVPYAVIPVLPSTMTKQDNAIESFT